jgi:thioredoxin reductase
LSIAAHLKKRGVDFRIFGNPMHTWIEHMPKGMHLKSEGFASSLYDPDSAFTLEAYCKEKGLPYSRVGLPVALEVFVAYGQEFQRRMVPELQDNLVVSLKRSPEGFQVRLDDGKTFLARRVVMAVGLTHYKYLPPAFADISEEFLTHSSRHHSLDHFGGRQVAVIGAGASALDLAALLHQCGARVDVVARKPVIRFHDPPKNLESSLFDEVRSPTTGIGRGWRLFLCTNAPLVFRRMPQKFRLDKVRTILGPAPCWFTKDQVVGKVSLNVGMKIEDVKVHDGRVSLQLMDSAGSRKTLTADHVIAATGYRVDLRRLGFMDATLRAEITSVEQTPVLSSNFESSVPGLYFVGASAANTFGPLLRFAFGAGFTARRLSNHLARTARQQPGREALNASVQASDRDAVYSDGR